MINLISMTDYIIQQHEQCISSTGRTYNYAKFLKQPLELWMFVPCDEYGNILKEPQSIRDSFNLKSGHGGFFDQKSFLDYIIKFEKAKERCLFEGFSDTTGAPQYSHYISDGMQSVFYVTKNGTIYNKILGMRTVEDLTNKTTIFLTQTAIKKLGL